VLAVGGRIGALGVTLSVPFFTYWLNLACSPQTGCLLGSQILHLRTLWNTSRFFSLEACYVYLGWYLYLVLCWLVLPGRWVDGTVLRDGKRLSYKINGQFLLTHLLNPSFHWQ
jgi:delta14-sterol reductase